MRKQRSLTCLALALAVVGRTSTADAGEVSFDRKMVWAHAMTAFPLDLEVLKPYLPDGWEQLYSIYPLDTRRSWPKHDWKSPDIKSAMAAGVDGFAVDMFLDGNAANGYLAAADGAGSFEIAGLIEASNDESAVVKAIETYCKNARAHRSAALIGDNVLMFTYATTKTTVDAWMRVRAKVASDGFKVVLMADLGPDETTEVFDAESMTRYSAVFDSVYSFRWPGKHFDSMVDTMAKQRKPYAGGMMPEYDRVGGGYIDARGTATYREHWQKHLDTHRPWILVSTWNDLSEHTAIMPTSDWNLTRSDVTAWYAGKWKDKLPWTAPRLYVTTPQLVYPSTAAQAEALVLNGSDRPVTVSTELLDKDGRAMGAGSHATIAAHSEGASNLPLSTEAPPGTFVRVRATVQRGDTVVCTVVSAPVLVVSSEAQPGLRTRYYSIPADHVLPGDPLLVVHGNPVSNAGAEATVTALPVAADAVRFVDVIANGEIARTDYTADHRSLPLPVRSKYARKMPDGTVAQPVGAIRGETSWGWYLARVVDSTYLVSYSTPQYFAPPEDVSIVAQYDFDEGSGTLARDSSPNMRAAELTNTSWISPGSGGRGAAVHFDGQTSRINFGEAFLPSAPLSIKFAVRPLAYTGYIFSDSGGLSVGFSSDGRLAYGRPGNARGRWVVAHGKTKIPINEWSSLEFVWDGHMSRIFVNGALDGETACEPSFTSARIAAGYNPFGAGSSYFTGDIDAIMIRTLKAR